MNDRWGRRLYNIVLDEKANWKALTTEQQAEWSAMAEHFIKAVIPNGYVVIEQERLSRLVAAASKLRHYARNIVGYGGSVPAAEAITDEDLAA